MPEYIRKDAVLWITAELGAWETQNRVRELPAEDVQPAPQWISVHDSIPSDNKPYAVVTKNNGLGVSRLMGRNKLEWTLFGEPVLYWMPLPEPPKE